MSCYSLGCTGRKRLDLLIVSSRAPTRVILFRTRNDTIYDNINTREVPTSSSLTT